MLEDEQAQQLAHAGLDYYNHNLDTSPEFYGQVISTRTYQDRLDTLDRVRDAGINVLRRHHRDGRVAPRARGLISQLANRIRIRIRCRSTTSSRSKARRSKAPPLDPFEFAHDRGRAHHDAEGRRAPVGRPRAARRRLQALSSCGRELDVLRRPAADDEQPDREDRALFERLGMRASDADAMSADA
jgi:biotin synthase